MSQWWACAVITCVPIGISRTCWPWVSCMSFLASHAPMRSESACTNQGTSLINAWSVIWKMGMFIASIVASCSSLERGERCRQHRLQGPHVVLVEPAEVLQPDGRQPEPAICSLDCGECVVVLDVLVNALGNVRAAETGR